MQYTDFEIGLHRRSPDVYSLEMRFNLPDDEADQRTTGQAQFDFDGLRALVQNPAAYGQKLSEELFASPDAQAAFARAQTAVQQKNPPLGLRVRLVIGSSAPELHRLYWETLALPQSKSPLSTNETILFSRYFSSRDWRPVRLRPQSALRALVVVASPSNVEQYRLPPIDVEGETKRAIAGLGSVTVTLLPDGGTGGLVDSGAGASSSEVPLTLPEQRGGTVQVPLTAPERRGGTVQVPLTAPERRGGRRPTLNALVDRLREGAHDILYLVCHGALIKDEPWLLLEDDEGKAQRISGIDLANRLQDLPERPRLVVLLSCQSAGEGTGDALAALGPRLAEAGIPAVLAMQGNFSVDTATRFMPVFFRELGQDGQIDRALAVARGEVRDRFDFWMPVLFSRLKSGQVWYVPRFSTGGAFDAWEALHNAILEKRCTPVLGPGLMESWFGQPGEIARRWAEKYRYPLAPDDRDELSRVAQYISRRDGANALQSEYHRALREEILRRYQAILPEDLARAEFWKAPQVLKAMQAVVNQRWDSPVTRVQQQLADLCLPIYITTNPDDLLVQALKKRSARPQVRLCPWWGPEDEEELESKCLYDGEPTVEEPLVYYLYGRLDTPASLVISEDNYFDFLIGYTRNKKHIPPIVLDVLMSTSLLFLGFRTDDWGYRVLFRTLIAQKGVAQFRENRHVNAQVEPEEGRLIDTQRARRYLEEIFTKDNIAIYWGRSEDFMNDLAGRNM